jgi:hypothetical protein
MIKADKNITPEQIHQNWNEFLNIIDTYISSPRKEQLLDFYKEYEERFILMPASHKKEYHNAYPGGYIAHVLNVIKAALKIDPNHLGANEYLGELYLKLKQPAKANAQLAKLEQICGTNCAEYKDLAQDIAKYKK